MTTIRLEPLDGPTPDDVAAIIAPLGAATEAAGFRHDPQAITLVLRDSSGAILGGVIGETLWGWLHVRILAVSESLRGRGLGRELMVAAERIAVERGCGNAWVDTFSFQARPFYERLGYRVFGELPAYPGDETRYFLRKALNNPGDPTPPA